MFFATFGNDRKVKGGMQKGKCSLQPLGMIGKLREEFWIELKTEDWIIKAFHQSVNQSHVLSTLFHVEYPTGTWGAL